jgi:hypothetical protein
MMASATLAGTASSIDSSFYIINEFGDAYLSVQASLSNLC